jgi:hypothetical protein
MAKDGDRKPCKRCRGTMIYRVKLRIDHKHPQLPEAKTATGWFCARCPHTEIHVVMQ